jgi:HEAT repeat protein
MTKHEPKLIAPYLSGLTSDDYKVRRDAVKGLRQSRNPDAYPHLIAALDDPAVSVLIHAIRGLETLGDRRAIPALLAKLGGSSCDVCDEIGAALVSFGDDAVPHLLEALNAPHPRVRAIAVTALNQLEDDRAVEPIIALLDDPDSSVVNSVLRALWDIADERVREPLAAYIARAEVPFDLRRSAAFALAELGDPRAIDVLQHSFTYETRLCVDTIQQLGKIDDPRVRPLIQVYIDEDPESLCASQARATLEHLTSRGY